MRLTRRGRIVLVLAYVALIAALVATVAQGYGECRTRYSVAQCA
jgi:hypothetical protein